MHFAPDTEGALLFAVALANTAAGATRSGADELDVPERLTALLDDHRYSGRFDRDWTELAEVRATRNRLRQAWTLDRDDLAHAVNDMLADAGAMPYLVRHDGQDWHLHATRFDAPLAERIRVEVSLALVDVVRTDSTGRLRDCDATDCSGVLVDLSRNGSKRFCSIRCGNRMNMAAFRDRVGAG